MKPEKPNWLWRVLISIDQLGNAVTGGDEDETISSRAAKSARQGKTWGVALCKFLHWIDKDHCEKSLEHDEGKPTPNKE